jgi:SEFIR domain
MMAVTSGSVFSAFAIALCHDDGMAEAKGPDVVVRFAVDVAEPARASLLGALRDCGTPASTGWDLGYRGPDADRPWLIALLNLAGDVTEIGTAAVGEIGSAVGGFLRRVSSPDEVACVDLVERPSQRVWRLRVTDTPLAYRRLAIGVPDAPSGAADAPVGWNGIAWSETVPAPAHPVVFVSYAHENDQHRADVLALCEVLAGCGVEPRLDRYHVDERRDWQRWATEQIMTVDYILVIASTNCRRVGDGMSASQDNRGLQAEMRTLRELYTSDNSAWSRRILPVVLPGQSPDEIPVFLQPWTADHYPVPEISPAGAASLLEVLHGVPPLRPPTVGPGPGAGAGPC